MPHAFHFIAGLPRSGSTLLSAILRQNPRFHAGMTGPVGSMIDALLRNMSMSNEFSVFITDAQREALLRSVFATFYADIPDHHVVFDSNRMWCARLPLISALFPQARVICCVRDIPWILDSIERLIRLLLAYETLTRNPQEAMAAIYEFIGEKPFAHDFENVEFDATEFDRRLGTPGLHLVGRRVKHEERRTVLPPDLVAKFAGDAFWRDPARNPNKVRVV